MSHPEQLGFFAAVAAVNKPLIEGARALEIGSYDVNGSVRAIFSAADEYVGVDLEKGPGVDLVAFGHQLDHMDGSYDVTLSGECFEHDPHWADTLANMIRMTRPGGLVAFTCASRGRAEHGTRRTDTRDSPGTQAEGIDYYRNLSAADIEARLPLARMFERYRFWYLPTSFDLYFAGVRAGEPGHLVSAAIPSEDAVQGLRSLMPLTHKLARVPLRGLSRSLSERHYQTLILPYWRLLLRMAPGQQRACRTAGDGR